ncbi:hypothetical protein VPH35_031864 [Triticum aestivum]
MYVRPLLLLLLFAPLLRTPSSSSLQGESSDREALLAFKEGLSDRSGSLSSWSSTNADHCRWAGVACSRRHPGRVVSLSLPSKDLVGSISPAIGNLTFLRTLQLGSNVLSGEIPHTIGRLRRLRHLSLVNNSIGGEIPQELCNCSNLVSMTLGKNQLQGEIPPALGSLSQLQLFYLTTNNVVGGVPPSFGNLSSLARLSLYENKMEGPIPEGLSRLPHLQFIQVARNNLSGTIPLLFFNMSSLQYLGFGSNKLQGSLPPDDAVNLPILEELHLGNNHLSGRIPSSFANSTRMQLLSLARNNFHGRVAPNIGKLCPVRVELGSNRLQADDAEGWEFLRFFTNCTGLQLMDLNENDLGGVLPGYVANFSRQIQWLSMAGNRITGTIPSGIGNLVNLNDLELGGNNLHGPIPEEIGRLKNLQTLLLQQNDLSGHLPSSLGNLTLLQNFSLSNNRIDGPIPKSLGNLQQLPSLDLSSNLLTGVIPDEIFSLPFLTNFLSLSNNYLSGPLPRQVGKLKNIASLDLSKNNLSGEIPGTLGDCASLVYLALDGNSFTGSIPSSLGNLRGLSRINLTKNELSGSIPRELAKINGLQQLYLAQNNLSGVIQPLFQNSSALIELDLSFNHLDGEVPSSGVFANMSRFSLIGNNGLCGGIPELKLPPCQVKTHKQGQKLLLSILLPVAGIAICFCLLVSALFMFKRKITVGRMKFAGLGVLGENYPRVSYFEMFEATDGFAPAKLIGAGKYGSVYKGNMSIPSVRNGAVAVKVFSLHQTGFSRNFLAECTALRRVKHRNLINIITCCSSIDPNGNDFRALVFEFMPNFSLDRWLHPTTDEQWHKLSIVQLLNIAVDVADALDYLHNNSRPSVIHCDLKPSNILLGSDWTAKVADFGLSKLVGEYTGISAFNSGSSVGIRGTTGYIAPEYGLGGQVSVAGDAYSFGITLREMFTGRAPTDDMFRDGLSLHLFAEMACPGRISEIIDQALLQVHPYDDGDAGLDNALACLASVVRIGILCSKETPSERMNMKNAAAELHKIRGAAMESSSL